jgi:hypothetical protein
MAPSSVTMPTVLSIRVPARFLDSVRSVQRAQSRAMCSIYPYDSSLAAFLAVTLAWRVLRAAMPGGSGRLQIGTTRPTSVTTASPSHSRPVRSVLSGWDRGIRVAISTTACGRFNITRGTTLRPDDWKELV